jgi:hypothetical protein
MAEAKTSYGITIRTARLYRDGLLLAFASLLPLRRNNLAQIALNKTLFKTAPFGLSPSRRPRLDIPLKPRCQIGWAV